MFGVNVCDWYIDPKGLKKLESDAFKALERLWRDCVRAFLDRIIISDLVKVDTGMSKASLLPLAAKVGYAKYLRATISSRISGRSWKLGYTDMAFNYHPKQYKSVAHGERLGKKAFYFRPPTKRNRSAVFQFSIVVFQYWIHESLENSGASSGWESLTAGQEAFVKYYDENAEKYVPDIGKYFNISTGVF